jgi:aldehyde dehydrogenase (NAD+)
MIDKPHFDRLARLLSGTAAACGGDTDDAGLYIAPTVIDNVDWRHDLMAEEIFGPILPVLTYSDLSQVICELNCRPRPLSIYIFSKSRKIQKKIIKEVPFGCGGINDTVMHIIGPHLPYGGVGDSGMGRYHGKASFETFSYQKTILNKPPFPDNPLRYPPYTNLKLKLVKILFG